MGMNRRKSLQTGAAAAASLALARRPLQAAPATPLPYEPNWDSLAQYQCPEWYRDAKFGIWAHWTAQCVPEQGDWYARQMYQEGTDDYNYEVAHYGHPSQVGFKEMEHRWKAENWDPDALMSLYKAAGAKYFVALAQHHDNFDCFDSIYQPWNSVALGPKKDLVGTWAKAARKAGLRFGVSSHGSHAWSWYEPAQGADKKGPLMGVPYDGGLTRAEGKGKWWDGLDPQDLYAQNHKPMGLEWDWDNKGQGDLPDKAYCSKFFNRTVDLLDKYRPDLVYFDDTILPLYQVDPSIGLRIAAHHYNGRLQKSTPAKRSGTATDAVLCGKGLSSDQAKCILHDFERGRSSKIVPQPWQTDTCIGSWHYQRSVFENHQYKTPNQVIKMLLDIVSKNGNLLLSIPVRGDGTIDADEKAFLDALAAWMAVNQEAIFGTRPWSLSGEGLVQMRGGGFSEGGEERLTEHDFRFTTKGNTLYAAAMGWPVGGKLTLRTLAASAQIVGQIETVHLLGSPAALPFTRTAEGLVVNLPAQKPCDHVFVLRITGLDLAASRPVSPPPPVVRPSTDGSLTLAPSQATLSGPGNIQVQAHPVENIGYWSNTGDTAAWHVHFNRPGSYRITAKTSASDGDTAFVVDTGAGVSSKCVVPRTGGWDIYGSATGGVIQIPADGDFILTARPADPATWHAMNLASLLLTPDHVP